MRHLLTAAVCVSLVASPAYAAPNLVVFALQNGDEQIRYFNGVPTVTLDGKRGGVQIGSLPFDHGGLSFSVGVFNDSDTPAVIDVGSITVKVDGAPVRIFTREELERAAKRRAGWKQFGIALAGGLATYGAATQRDTYTATTRTPHGTYRTTYSAPTPGREMQAAVIAGGTGLAINQIQDRLDRTLGELGETTLQLTTVEPDESYGGRIVTAKIKPRKYPARIDVTVNWNDEVYPFAFQLAPGGSPVPPFRRPPRPPVEAPPVQPAAVQAAPEESATPPQ